MRRILSRWGWVLGASALLAACGPEPVAEEKPSPTASLNQELSGECRPTAESVEGSGLSLRCDGPWEYRKLCPKQSATAVCGIQGYELKKITRDKTCPHKSFGSKTRGPQSFPGYKSAGQKRKFTLCDYSTHPPCATEISYADTITCAERSAQALNAAKATNEDPSYPLSVVRADTVGGTRVYGTEYLDYRTSISTMYVTPYTDNCDIELGNIVTEWNSGQHPSCGTEDVWVEDHDKPIYNSCRHDTHGYEDNAAVCDGISGYGLFYSWPSLTQTEINGVDPRADTRAGSALLGRPVCVTGEQISFSDVEARYTHLMARMGQLAIPPYISSAETEDPGLRIKLVQALKLLVELHGDSPALDVTETVGGVTLTRRERLLQLYTAYPESDRLTRVESDIGAIYGYDSPAPGHIAPNTFSARWSASLQITQPGTYSFQAQSDDGVRVFIDGQPVIDQWINQAPTWSYGTVDLAAGRHSLTMEYFENGGYSVSLLNWLPPGETETRPIPPEAYYLPASEEHGVLAEYFDTMDLGATVCANSWAPPVTEAACPAAAPVNTTFAMCRMMARSHVSAKTAAAALERCARALDDAEATACTRGKYSAEHASIMSVLTTKTFSLPLPTQSAQRQPLLKQRLIALDRWYRASVAADPSRATKADFWDEVSARLGSFWKAAHESVYSVANITPTNVPANLEEQLDNYSLVDREVLTLAFPESPTEPLPLGSAPLLLVLNDGLQNVAERLDNAGFAHDLGCRFKGCGPGRATSSVSEMWSLLAALTSQTELGTALTGASHLTTASPEWKQLFTRIHARHADLTAAVADAFRVEAPTTSETTAALLRRLVDTPPDAMPVPASPLSALLRRSAATAGNFRASGFLTPVARDVLYQSMSYANQQGSVDLAYTRLDALEDSVERYASERANAIAALVNEMNQTASAERVRQQIELELARFAQADENLSGLRHRLAVEDARLAEFGHKLMSATGPIIAEGHLLLATNMPQDSVATADLSISARSARFLGPQDIGLIAAPLDESNPGNPWKMSALKGQLVEVGVSGGYAPTCAMRRATTFPHRNPLAIETQFHNSAGQLKDVLAGPEGYLLTVNNSTYRARSNDRIYEHSQFTKESESYTDCLSGGFTVKVPVPGIDAAGMGSATSSQCNAWERGSSRSLTARETNATGADTRVSASYASGLRLEGTPFEDLPVGSLLLLEVVPGGTGPEHIREVHLLRSPRTTVLMENDADLYFVVNDSALCTGAVNDSDKLEVHLKRWAPAGATLPGIIDGLVEARARLNAQTNSLLQQGRVSAQDLAALRAETSDALTDECNCTLSQVPERLRSIFSSFIERDLAALERKAEIRATERAMDLARMQLKALADEVANHESQARLLRLLPGWALRNMKGERLRQDAEAASRQVLEELWPIVHLRYPTLITQMTTPGSASLLAINGLIDGAWSESPHQQATRVVDFMRSIRSTLQTAINRQDIPETGSKFPVVGVFIPRPGWYEEPPTGPHPMGRTMDDTRARQVWSALEDSAATSLTLSLRPDDLYQVGGGQAVLSCFKAVPVVRAMGLYFTRASWSTPETFNVGHLNLDTRAESTLLFPTAQGPATYHLTSTNLPTTPPSGQWRLMSTYVAGGEREFAIAHFEQYLSGYRDADGISPFGSFEFTLNPALRGYLNDFNALLTANGVMVMFEVDPVSLGSNMTWIGSCQQ
ncbi:PA14 domain-containing protein [Myxococcaceae bacterium GXIMD 01537]